MSDKTLPSYLTSYDFLKTLALVLMIVGHIGAFLFPEELWLRAVGRMSAPIWLFLIGYAQTRDIPVKLWAGAFVLLVSDLIIAQTFFPVTILFGMIAVRFILDKTAAHFFDSLEHFLKGLVFVLVLSIPSYMVVEYGVFCLVIALYGYFIRWNAQKQLIKPLYAALYGVLACGGYVVMALLSFTFAPAQAALVVVGCAAVFVLLWYFKPREYAGLAGKMPRPLTWFFQLCGRRSLELYVGHILLFKVLACAMGVAGYGLFEWKWF